MHIYAHVHVNICAQIYRIAIAYVHMHIYAHVHVNICTQIYRRAIALAYEDHFHIATKKHATSATNLL